MSFRRIGRLVAVMFATLLLVAGFALPFRILAFGIRDVATIQHPQLDVSQSAIPNPQSQIRNSKSEIPKIPPAALAKIEPLVLKQIIEEGQATFIVYLREQADLSASAQIKSLTERRLTVVDTLRATAERSQRDVIAFLRKQEQAGHASNIISLWVFNGVAVTGDGQTLAEIAMRPDVVEIRANRVRHLPEPVPSPVEGHIPDPVKGSSQDETENPRPQTVLWNIDRIRADAVWNDLGITGEGVVVAGLDSGVSWQHNALRDKYRGKDGNHNYNWFDPTGTSPQAPTDGLDHGTHTMGTIVGDGVDENGERLQVGVAPGAQWIAVKAFDDRGVTTDLWLHQGFQWVLAPTDLKGENPDPTKAPDVVNNSWGSLNGGDGTFRPDVQALRAAGIVPVFSAGNLRQGQPAGGSVGSPASFPESLAVGATDPDDLVASFSDQGPSFWGELKPEFSAPGQYIRSTVSGDKYSVLSGTSMAAPHVSGAVALMLEAARKASVGLSTAPAPSIDGVVLQRADPEPSVGDLEQLLALTAVDIGEAGPDNVAGAGRIDAYRATEWAMSAGKLYGYVRDSVTGTPVVAAEIVGVSSTSPEDQFTTRSQSDGEYSVAVTKGRYAIEVTAFGYEPSSVQEVEVVAGFLSLRNINLKPSPTGTVAGQIRTADGVPIPGTVEVVSTPLTAQTDGKGTYSIDLPAGTHTLRVAAAGYRTETADVTVSVGERIVQTFVLMPAPAMLFVDADQWANDNVSLYYEFVLDRAGIPYDTRPITTIESIPTIDELSAYDVVIWTHPWTSPGTIDLRREDTATVDLLTGFLAQGGRLLLMGQDIGWLDGGGNPANPTTLPYYEDFLHARFTDNSISRTSNIVGVDGDIMAGVELQFDTIYAYKRSDNGFSPDGIEPADEAAQLIFEYGAGAGAGIKVQDGNYRLVYLGFAADTTGPREPLIDAFAKAYDWLSRPVLTKSVDKARAMPGERLTYTVTLENALGAPLENVMISDHIPAEMDFVFNTVTGGAVYNRERRTIEWSGSLPARESAAITFQADLKGNLAGDTLVTNTAKAQVGELELEAKASTRILGPNLSGSKKAVDKERVSAGEIMTYTIQLLNSSPVTATNVTLVDRVPSGTEYVNGSATGGATYDAGSRELRWSGEVPAAVPEDAPYTWIDSDTEDGPTYVWDSRAEDQGRPVSDMGDDTISEELPIGFTFPFYGEEFTTFRVASNGFLTFTGTGAPFTNLRLPSRDAPGNLIAPLWDDFTLVSQGTIYAWSNNVDTLVVSWVGVLRFGGAEPYTFQAILHSDGEILLQYRQLGAQTESATIGIQNGDGTVGVTVAYNQEYVHEELAVLLVPPRPPVTPPVITFRVRVNEDIGAGTIITNTAQVDDGRGQVTVLTATTRANVTDLTGSRKRAPDLVLPGDTITYTLSLSNTGGVLANVTLVDPIPDGTDYQENSVRGGATYDSEANAIRWAGEVQVGQSHTLTFTVAVDSDVAADSVITNTAMVDDGVNPPFDLVAITKIMSPDLSRSAKFVDRAEARSGDVLNYTISVENNSPVPVDNVSLIDQLPEGLTYVPDSVTPNATFDPTDNTVRWTGALPARGEGYVWDDSDAPTGPIFAWDDRAETMGVRLRDRVALADDTNTGPFPIGFAFPFFDERFTEFYLSTNGFASFSRPTERYFTNRELPEPDRAKAVGNLLAVFWDDLDLRSEGEIYYWTNEVDTLVISWVGVPHLARGGPYTFQAILRNDGTIIYQYKEMAPDRLEEATIGIQNAAGDDGLTIAHDEPYVHSNLAVRIAPPTGREQIQFQAMIDEGVAPETVLVNTVVIKDGLGNQIEREAKTVANTVDLSGVSMRASASEVMPGGRLTYQFIIPNAGTGDAEQTLVVNPLPETLAYVEGSATAGAFYEPDLREIRWQGTVPAGEAVSFEYSVDALPPLRDGDIISSTATINDGLHPAIMRSVSVQVIAPDLSRSEKRAPAMVGRGATLRYLVRIVNSGHAPAEVTFADALPAGVTFVEGSADASFGGPLSFSAETGTLSWSGTVPARGIAELRFSVMTAGGHDAITNMASVDDGLGATMELESSTRVVPYRFLFPLMLKNAQMSGR